MRLLDKTGLRSAGNADAPWTLLQECLQLEVQDHQGVPWAAYGSAANAAALKEHSQLLPQRCIAVPEQTLPSLQSQLVEQNLHQPSGSVSRDERYRHWEHTGSLCANGPALKRSPVLQCLNP